MDETCKWLLSGSRVCTLNLRCVNLCEVVLFCVCVCSLEHSFWQLFIFRVKGGTCRCFWSFLLKPCKAVTRLLDQSCFKRGPLTNAGPRAVCDGLQPSKYRNSEHNLRHWHQFERVILRLLNLIIKIKGLYLYVFLFHFHFLIFITYFIFLFHFLVTHLFRLRRRKSTTDRN